MVVVIPKTIMLGIEKEDLYSDKESYYICFKNGNAIIKSRNMSLKEVNEKYGFAENEILKIITGLFR